MTPARLTHLEEFAQTRLAGAGPVTMASLDQLSAALTALRAQLDRHLAEANEADALTADQMAALGALLVPRHAWWGPPVEFHASMLEADRLATRIARLDQEIARAPAGGGLVALAARFSGRDPVNRRSRTAGQLRRILIQIASRAISTVPAASGVPDAEILISDIFDLRAQAAAARGACVSAEERLLATGNELRVRQEAARQLGFDALYLAACFKTQGLPAVETPAPLERGEVAHLCVGTMLSRGVLGLRGPGTTPPPAHTGVRFWVGTFRSGAAPPAAPIETGTLTVSNRYLHFTGTSQSFATPLDNVVEADLYDNAMVVTSLGRESADFYRLEAPKEVAFYMNWAQEGGSR